MRDNYKCAYCGYRTEIQIVDHIDGDPENNSPGNLQTICHMCNLIKHAGMGCVVSHTVDLYRKSKFSQTEIIQKTRKLRVQGKSDEEIVNHLGLEGRERFKMDREYLKNLYGFVTARKWNK